MNLPQNFDIIMRRLMKLKSVNKLMKRTPALTRLKVKDVLEHILKSSKKYTNSSASHSVYKSAARNTGIAIYDVETLHGKYIKLADEWDLNPNSPQFCDHDSSCSSVEGGDKDEEENPSSCEDSQGTSNFIVSDNEEDDAEEVDDEENNDESLGDRVWEVEAINGHEMRGSELYYIVKWKLKEGAHEWWGPEENYVREVNMNADELVEEYWTRMKNRGQRDMRAISRSRSQSDSTSRNERKKTSRLPRTGRGPQLERSQMLKTSSSDSDPAVIETGYRSSEHNLRRSRTRSNDTEPMWKKGMEDLLADKDCVDVEDVDPPTSKLSYHSGRRKFRKHRCYADVDNWINTPNRGSARDAPIIRTDAKSDIEDEGTYSKEEKQNMTKKRNISSKENETNQKDRVDERTPSPVVEPPLSRSRTASGNRRIILSSDSDEEANFHPSKTMKAKEAPPKPSASRKVDTHGDDSSSSDSDSCSDLERPPDIKPGPKSAIKKIMEKRRKAAETAAARSGVVARRPKPPPLNKVSKTSSPLEPQSNTSKNMSEKRHSSSNEQMENLSQSTAEEISTLDDDEQESKDGADVAVLPHAANVEFNVKSAKAKNPKNNAIADQQLTDETASSSSKTAEDSVPETEIDKQKKWVAAAAVRWRTEAESGQTKALERNLEAFDILYFCPPPPGVKCPEKAFVLFKEKPGAKYTTVGDYISIADCCERFPALMKYRCEYLTKNKWLLKKIFGQ